LLWIGGSAYALRIWTLASSRPWPTRTDDSDRCFPLLVLHPPSGTHAPATVRSPLHRRGSTGLRTSFHEVRLPSSAPGARSANRGIRCSRIGTRRKFGNAGQVVPPRGRPSRPVRRRVLAATARQPTNRLSNGWHRPCIRPSGGMRPTGDVPGWVRHRRHRSGRDFLPFVRPFPRSRGTT